MTVFKQAQKKKQNKTLIKSKGGIHRQGKIFNIENFEFLFSY